MMTEYIDKRSPAELAEMQQLDYEAADWDEACRIFDERYGEPDDDELESTIDNIKHNIWLEVLRKNGHLQNDAAGYENIPSQPAGYLN